MKRKHRRIKRRGYAGGGPVTASNYGVASDTSAETSQMAPVYMAVALDDRSHNPDHFSEDYAPNETIPEGAPEAPAEYARGGVVRKKGYEDGGEVDDDDEDYDDAPEASEEDDVEDDAEGVPPVRPRGPPSEEAEEEEEIDPADGGAGDEIQAGGEGQPVGEGGQRPSLDTDFSGRTRTGYGAAAEQPPEDEGRYSDAGYGAPMPEPEGMLKSAMRAIRQALGVEEPGTANRYSNTGYGAAVEQQPSYGPRTTLPAEGSILDNAAKSYQTSQMDPMTEGGLPTPPMTPATPGQRDPNNGFYQRGDLTGANDPVQNFARKGVSAIVDYFKGGGAMAQPQMEQALANTDKTSPGLDQAGKIAKTFSNIYAQDPKTAGEFVQAMKPSYENLRAAAMAAAGEGALAQAAQIATKMYGLIPDGKSVSFSPQRDGTIGVMVKDANNGGKPLAAFKLTPEQFANYLKGPASTLDGVVEMGAQKALASAGGKAAPMPGEQRQQSTGYQRAMADYMLQKRAYDAFPLSSQRGQRERLYERLQGKDSRVAAEREKQRAISERQDRRLKSDTERNRDSDTGRGLTAAYNAIARRMSQDAGYKPNDREQRVLDRFYDRYGGNDRNEQPQQRAPQQQSSSPQQSTPTTRTIGGTTYINRNGNWYPAPAR